MNFWEIWFDNCVEFNLKMYYFPYLAITFFD